MSVNYSSEQRTDALTMSESSEEMLTQFKLLNARIEEAYDTHINIGDIE